VPSAKRKLRATRRGGNPGPPAMGNSEASGQGRARRHWQGGKPPSHPAKGKLRANWWRGNPELCGEKKALSHLGEGKT
jgi:hypothetical protein